MSRIGWSLALAVFVSAGCDRPRPKRAYECTCEYTTDTDVPGKQDVRVCGSEPEDPRSLAAECAQGLGVGHVEQCTCSSATTDCTGPACEQAAASKSR